MKKRYPFLIFLCCGLMLSNFQVFAQDEKKNESQQKDKEYKLDKEKKDREHKYDKKDEKEKKDREYEKEKNDREYKKNKNGNDDKYERRDRSTTRRGSGFPGRVIMPRKGTNSPRQLEGVPKGHYPPPGSCRIWYPNRPAGHQPPPASCSSLYGVALEPGAFILHGDSAYDADYNWKEEERRRPGTVDKDILDILFPNR